MPAGRLAVLGATTELHHGLLALIINPTSGHVRGAAGRSRADLARQIVSRLGVEADIAVTERSGHAADLARSAVARGARAVVAWGGDGTINEVASVLAFGAVPLGVVPAGSGNGLARELGIDRDPVRAIAAAATRTAARAIDIGEIDQRLFVNAAGVGVDAYISAAFNAAGNRRRGFFGYASITTRAMRTYVPANYRITTGSGVTNVRAVVLTVANSAQFGNGARIAPGAKLDDGLLDLVFIEERSRLTTISYVPRLFRGTITEVPECRLERVAEATIECDVPMTYHVDGEAHVGGTTLHTRVHPGALQVLA